MSEDKKPNTYKTSYLLDEAADAPTDDVCDELMKRFPFAFFMDIMNEQDKKIAMLGRELNKMKNHDHLNGKMVVELE